MPILSNSYTFTFIIISTLFFSACGYKRNLQNDGLCPNIDNILCVKKILSDIAHATKIIDDIAQRIERDIVIIIYNNFYLF